MHTKFYVFVCPNADTNLQEQMMLCVDQQDVPHNHNNLELESR